MAEEEIQQEDLQQDESLRDELRATEQKALDKLKALKRQISEDEQTPVGAMTLRKILGGDVLSAMSVRRQIWLILLVVLTLFVGSYYIKYPDIVPATITCRLLDKFINPIKAVIKK